ncbi:MAG: stage II sporulation protein M [Gammaproteobacteria bacterium]
MKQVQFEKKYEAFWQNFEFLVNDLNKSKSKQTSNLLQRYKFPKHYRELCNHFAIAKQRHYSPILTQRLHNLVLKGHEQIYRNKTIWLWKVIEFLTRDFPYLIRKHFKVFWLAAALFYLPGIMMGIACFQNSEIIYSVMDQYSVASMEYMYDPENKKLGRDEDRQADTDIMMFGYYIFNNISVGFRTFASGILLGIGSIFFLFYNGLVIGGVAGYLTKLGFIETFWSFVSGHGSFELTAIVICGMAGLLLAKPIFSPGNMTRADSLKVIAKDSIQLVMGAALMLVIAAFIEAFWSPSSFVSSNVKYTVAAILWAIVIFYFIFAGRNKYES